MKTADQPVQGLRAKGAWGTFAHFRELFVMRVLTRSR